MTDASKGLKRTALGNACLTDMPAATAGTIHLKESTRILVERLDELYQGLRTSHALQRPAQSRQPNTVIEGLDVHGNDSFGPTLESRMK